MKMDNKNGKVSRNCSDHEEEELRRGPWTVEEDLALINYIAHHGDGRWNSLAGCAGLKRTGKSCRLRWLNYLRPEVRRGNITLEEQLLILELHSRWGNRWSKIAQHLPGRTDNEIKNYWRTRVQKQAKQLKCDVNSKQFKDAMRYLWMPRLVERIQLATTGTLPATTAAATTPYPPLKYQSKTTSTCSNLKMIASSADDDHAMMMKLPPAPTTVRGMYTPETSSAAASSDSFGTQVSELTDQSYKYPANEGISNQDYFCYGGDQLSLTTTPIGYNDFMNQSGFEFDHGVDHQWMDGGDDVVKSLWNVDDDDFWFSHHQLSTNV